MAIAQKSSHKYLYLALTLVVVAAVVVVLEVTNRTHFFHKSATVSAPIKTAGNPAQSLHNSGIKNPSSGAALSQGTATDKNGQAPSNGVSTDPTQWSTSASRLITVKAPLRNATFHSGDTITGATSVSNQVEYRLVDNQVGVISQGSINVVDGNFTATINFTPHSNSGSLDIFNTGANGREANEVQILLNY